MTPELRQAKADLAATFKRMSMIEGRCFDAIVTLHEDAAPEQTRAFSAARFFFEIVDIKGLIACGAFKGLSPEYIEAMIGAEQELKEALSALEGKAIMETSQ